MKNFYSFILCTTLLVLSANSLFAQESIEIDFNQSSKEWVKYKTHDLADIYYKLTDCDEITQSMLFKVVNKSNQTINVGWEFKLFYDEEEVIKAPDDMIIQITLEAGSSKEGSCDFSDTSKLNVFVAERGGAITVTKIDLVDIKINEN